MTILDLEDAIVAPVPAPPSKPSSEPAQYQRVSQVSPDNTFSIANAPDERWNEVLQKVYAPLPFISV
jgi:hypothetical protein